MVEKMAEEQNCDILLVTEPNKKVVQSGGWYCDLRIDAAVKVLSRAVSVIDCRSGNGFVWIETDKYKIYSCYISPNCAYEEYHETLERLRDHLVVNRNRSLVTGDFNAKSYLWGNVSEDKRGKELADLIGELEMCVLNQGNQPTFVRGQSSSIIDITFASPKVAQCVKGWHVHEDAPLGDHLPIVFALQPQRNRANEGEPPSRWRWSETCRERLFASLRNKLKSHMAISPEKLTSLVIEACKENLTRYESGGGSRRKVYWWNDQIRSSRTKCVKARRTLMRANRRKRKEAIELMTLEADYAIAKKELRKQIKIAKDNAWKKLIDELEEDPWGKAYQVVMKKLKRETPPTLNEKLRNVKALFPQKIPILWEPPTVQTWDPFTREELATAAAKIRVKKASGPDGIPPEVVRLACEAVPEVVLGTMNRIMKSGVFPPNWKTARLVLIPKKGMDEEGNRKMRPICLLDVFGKLLEHLIRARLNEDIDDNGGLSDQQFGFREGRCTLDAVTEVMKLAKFANNGTWGRKDYCALVTLDIENAFNSASWLHIIEQLRRRGIKKELLRLIMSYLEGRRIEVTPNHIVDITCGVPQGSVLGPSLWNILYDGVLKQDMPLGVKLVAFADDLAVAAIGRNEEDLMRNTNQALARVASWLEENELKLAAEKTEAVLLVGRRRPRAVQFQIMGAKIEPKKVIKYLGIYIDQACTFSDHLAKTAAKAEGTISALSRIMPNIGGPGSNRRKLLAGVATSMLLYGCEVWHTALATKKNVVVLESTHRRILARVACAYRTVSTEAAQVITGVPPARLLVEERVKQRCTGMSKSMARSHTLNLWQENWQQTTKARWTRRLIPDIEKWVKRKHGEIDYHLTQALTGHGCFGTYLCRIGKILNASCWYCGEEDTPSHTLFSCSYFDPLRMDVMKKILVWPEESNLIEEMLESPEKWDVLHTFVKKIMTQKEKKERELEAGGAK